MAAAQLIQGLQHLHITPPLSQPTSYFKALQDFEGDVWPGLCHQAYDLQIFPRDDFDASTKLLRLGNRFGDIRYQDFKDALERYFRNLALEREILHKSEKLQTFKSYWTKEKRYVEANSEDPKSKIVTTCAIHNSWEYKGREHTEVYWAFTRTKTLGIPISLQRDIVTELKPIPFQESKSIATEPLSPTVSKKHDSTSWTTTDDATLMKLKRSGRGWLEICQALPGKSITDVMTRYGILKGSIDRKATGRGTRCDNKVNSELKTSDPRVRVSRGDFSGTIVSLSPKTILGNEGAENMEILETMKEDDLEFVENPYLDEEWVEL
ncbi:MAG: hypothetical protein M1820_004026 [Bogoriella megaspora]|nr:MAG: hypothetical protein M1820_004026 [Bogoriella megaspora]